MLRAVKFLAVGASLAAAGSVPFLLKGNRNEKTLISDTDAEFENRVANPSLGRDGIPGEGTPAQQAAKAVEEQRKLCEASASQRTTRLAQPVEGQLSGYTSHQSFPSVPCQAPTLNPPVH